jgi:hypothetical protein
VSDLHNLQSALQALARRDKRLIAIGIEPGSRTRPALQNPAFRFCTLLLPWSCRPASKTSLCVAFGGHQKPAEIAIFVLFTPRPNARRMAAVGERRA